MLLVTQNTKNDWNNKIIGEEKEEEKTVIWEEVELNDQFIEQS